MAEQVTRKIEPSGDPNAKPAKQEQFGNNLGDIFDSLPETIVVEEPTNEAQADKPKEDNAKRNDSQKAKEPVREAEDKQPEAQAEEELADKPAQDEPEQDDDRFAELGDLELPSLTDDEPEAKDEAHTRADDEDAKKDIKDLKADPHVPAKTKKTIDRLLGKVNHLDKLYREKDVQLSQLRAELEQAKEAPSADPVAAEDRKELTMLRRRFALEKDDTIKSYDTKAKQAEATVMDIIKRNVKEDQAAQIEKIGLEAFSKMPQFKQLVGYLNGEDPGEAAILLNKFAEAANVKAEKQAKMQELSTESEQFWQEREQQSAKQQEQLREQSQKIEQMRTSFFQETVANDPIFKAIDTRALKGEALAKAETENAKRAIYQRELKALLRPPQNENEYKQIVYRAGLARPLAERAKMFEKENKILKERLGKIEQARSTRQSNVVTPPKPSDTPEDFVTGLMRISGQQL